MLLADLGADVLRISRPGGNGWPNPVVDRGRTRVEIDIRSEAGKAFCLEAADSADVLIEGFRPGVMEKLGLGPDALCTRNPRLVYGRMTGWGQTGPMARAAGHDINYIAITGALAAIGRTGQPATPPLNLVGDFGGGSMFLAFGIMAALWEREKSGKGQVIDAAIIDGVNSLMTMFTGLVPRGYVSMDRDRNLLGGAAPYYRCYLCADGREISLGPLEPHFYKELVERLGAPAGLLDRQNDQATWEADAAVLAGIFATQPAAHWQALLEGTDACFAVVVPLEEVPMHPQQAARGAHVERDGFMHNTPAPRFSRTPGGIQPDRAGDAAVAAWLARGRDGARRA